MRNGLRFQCPTVIQKQKRNPYYINSRSRSSSSIGYQLDTHTAWSLSGPVWSGSVGLVSTSSSVSYRTIPISLNEAASQPRIYYHPFSIQTYVFRELFLVLLPPFSSLFFFFLRSESPLFFSPISPFLPRRGVSEVGLRARLAFLPESCNS